MSFIFEPNHALHKRSRHNFWDKFHNSSHSGSAVVVVVKRRLAEAGQLQQPPLTLLTDGRRAHSEASGAYTVKVFGQGANSLSPHEAVPRAFSPNISTTPLRQWGFRQCLPFSWTTLRGKLCRHPIAVMGVVDSFGPSLGFSSRKLYG